MGITVEEKEGSSTGENKSPSPTKPDAGVQASGENVIPQMVVTSVEGVAEDVKIDSSSIEPTITEVKIDSSSTDPSITEVSKESEEPVAPVKESNVEEKKSAFQRPLVISGGEESSSVPVEDIEKPETTVKSEISDSSSRSTGQRPLIIECSESSKKQVVTDTSQLEKAEEKIPLDIHDKEEHPVSVVDSAVCVSSKSEEANEHSSLSAVKRPLMIECSESSKEQVIEISQLEKAEEKIQFDTRTHEQPAVIVSDKVIYESFDNKLSSNTADVAVDTKLVLPIESDITCQSENVKTDDSFFKGKGFPWKLDGKGFSFPKIHFGSKEQKSPTSGSQLIDKIKPQKSSKKEQKLEKSETQEYSLEAAEALNKFTNSKESYRKIDSDVIETVPVVSQPAVVQIETDVKFDSEHNVNNAASMQEPPKEFKQVSESIAENKDPQSQKSVSKEVSKTSKKEPSKETKQLSFFSRHKEPHAQEDIPKELSKTSKKELSKGAKQSSIFSRHKEPHTQEEIPKEVSKTSMKEPSKETKQSSIFSRHKEPHAQEEIPKEINKTSVKQSPETPESLYETCCLRLAYLIRNKALEIVADSTSKPSPPKKPPKPSAEAIARARAALVARRVQEYERRRLNFGDDIPVGYNGIRYADEDTESSTDYKDVEEYTFITNPECYSMIRKLKSDNKMDTFSVPSTCSGMSSYYTAETITLKDENSSENTLDTVSLGSNDSVVQRPSVSEKRREVKGAKNIHSFTKPLSPQSDINKSNLISSNVCKKPPPPIPPKPVLKRPDSKSKRAAALSRSHEDDISRFVNSLSLSPRPLLRSSSSASTKKRPLTIAEVKETEFSHLSKSKTSSNIQKKPVLDTVLVNKSLQSVRNLPKEHTCVSRSLSCNSKISHTSSPVAAAPKKQAPQRPPPPVIRTKSDGISHVSSSSVLSSSPPSASPNSIVAPHRKLMPRNLTSPPRPPPPSTKPVTKPLRPPPPLISKSQICHSIDTIKLDGLEQNDNKILSSTSVENIQIEAVDGVKSNSVDKIESNIVDEPPNKIECTFDVTEHANENTSLPVPIEECSLTHSETGIVNNIVIETRESKQLDTQEYNEEFKSQEVLATSFDKNIIIHENHELERLRIHEELQSCSEIKPDYVNLESTISKTNVANYVEFEHNSYKADQIELKTDVEPDKVINGKRPRPPPRIRRKRSRTVEIVPVVGKTIESRRRSQSLSSIEKISFQEHNFLVPEKPELRNLYTAVRKDPNKTKNIELVAESGLEHKSSSLEMISSRPLPPPPLPPRSKSHSSSRRAKSDERPRQTYQPSPEHARIVKSHENLSNSPKIKPPVRRKKESKRRFLSLDSQGNQEDFEKKGLTDISKSEQNISKKIESVSNTPPTKPERKHKISRANIQYDENANVADTTFHSLPNRSSRKKKDSEIKNFNSFSRPRTQSADGSELLERVCAPIPVQRSKSEKHRKKSHSSWYDESENPIDQADGNLNNIKEGSWEKVEWKPENENEFASEIVCPKRRNKSVKKPRETSKFYVDVTVEQDSVKLESSFPIHSTEDKETSPLPLECSEKSVQTSLETLSRGMTPHDERSDDTDELLDLAQTLQDELKLIINRHKFEEKNDTEEDVGSVSDSQSLTGKTVQETLDVLHTKERKSSSIRSSASDLWQMSSSDDSEVEGCHKEIANLTEVAATRKKKKLFYIAQEIMTSEEAFVDSLKLLNVDFKAAVEAASKQKGVCVVPDEVINQILNHLPQLQHLNENLLMELKERIDRWDEFNRIADVIVKMGPFLKLYSWYIQDFESMVALLEDAKKKYPLFAQVIKEFEMSPRCKRLNLSHYMLRPVQRIPQYRLLLQEYLHHLPEDSPDYENTLEALRIVSEVANHANESMKQGDNFQKLISIQSSILGQKEIIKPGRMFIKEGELMKLSRKGMQPRWFVLLNDLLLYLTPVQQGLYRINHELTLTGMKVAIPIQQDYQNEFSIISVTRSFTLAAKSQEERQEWIIALTKAIEENASKRSTFTTGRLQQKSQHIVTDDDDEAFVLGKKAPVWIPDARVTMCQLCTSEFTVTFRRHHCRACGKVVCSICSSNRISLQYLGNRIARVCDECYVKLGQGSTGCTESGETDSDNQQIAIKSHMRTDNRYHKRPKRQLPSVLKEVCANDQGSSISGYVQKKVGKSWKRNWFVVKDKVLYEYRASEDVAALRSIPLLGFQIETFNEPFEGVDPSLLFQLSHPGQVPVIFHAETPGSAERWIRALKEATILE